MTTKTRSQKRTEIVLTLDLARRAGYTRDAARLERILAAFDANN